MKEKWPIFIGHFLLFINLIYELQERLIDLHEV